jgi:membrane-associated phospholipid phosphatase
VLVALALLVVMGAPTLLVATVTAMLVALAVTVPVTLRWKISFHAAVSAGTVVVFAHVLPAWPAAIAGAAVVALVCWARVRLTHHTWPQVIVGAVVGTAATWATLAAFGLS